MPGIPRFILRPTALTLLGGLALADAPASAQPVGGDPAQTDARREQIIDALGQSGLSREEISDVLAKMGYQPLPPPAPAEAQAPPPVDPAERYLPLGSARTIQVPSDQWIDLPFLADGPGMLTIASWNAEGFVDVSVEVRFDGQVLNYYNEWGNTVTGIKQIPLGQAGTYTLRVAGTDAPFTLAAEWLPFPGLNGAQVDERLRPDLSDLVVLEPNTQLNTQIPANRGRYFVIQPETDGELIIDFEGNRGDLVLAVFQDFELADELMWFDSDLMGNFSREAASFPVFAGQTYQIRADANHDQDVAVRIRTTLIPEPPAPGQE